MELDDIIESMRIDETESLGQRFGTFPQLKG